MKFFLITTHHNQHSRWAYIKPHLQDMGITYTPILAPDYRLFRWHLDETQLKHQSLTLAYYQISQTAIFENLSQYAVIEDDVNLIPQFKLAMFNLQNSLPEDYDFCYLTQTEHNKEAAITSPVNDYICKVESNWWETPLTLWSRKFAEAFREHISEKLDQELWLGHIDHELVKLNATGKFQMYGATQNTANGLSSARHLQQAQLIDFQGSISEYQEREKTG